MTEAANSMMQQTSTQTVKPQYLSLLLMLYITFSLVGNALLYKLVKLDFIVAPGGIVTLPFVLLLQDIIAEVYGYRISRILLWYVLLSMLIFIFCIEIIVHMPSPNYWHQETSFLTVFGNLDKGVPVMVAAIFCGRFLNLYVITKLKILAKGRVFWLRSILACFAGDLVTLGIIYSIVFWSLPFAAKAHLLFSDMFVRVSYSIVGGIIGNFITNYLKHKENLDIYDLHTNFNPFKLSLSR